MIGIFLVLVLPFAVGMIWYWILGKEKKDWVLIYLYGSLTMMAAAGIVAMPAIKLRLSFGCYRILALGLMFMLGAAGMVLFVQSGFKAKDNWRIQLHTEKNSGWAWGGVLVVFLLLSSCFFQYVPAAKEDMTAETIHTTVRTDTLYEYNAATGELLTLGIYPQDKLVTLPLFYSLFYSLGPQGQQLSMRHFLYEFVPVWILLLNFLVFWKWGESLFLGQKREKLRLPLFLCFYGAANLFGDYLFITFSYKLLHQTWTGETVFVTVLLPLLALQIFDMMRGEKSVTEWWQDKIMRRKLVPPVLCILTGIFCAPWRETIVLCAVVLAAGAVTAVIWRKQYERDN